MTDKKLYINIYRVKTSKDCEGYISSSSSERETEINTLDDVKRDLYKWLVHDIGEYVATLSNDGVNHTPEVAKEAEYLQNAIFNIYAYGGRPKDLEWDDVEAELESCKKYWEKKR